MKHLTLEQVVEGDYCIGCGLCVSQSTNGRMRDTNLGTYIPDLSSLTRQEIEAAEAFCPSAKASDLEDVIAEDVFELNELKYLDGLGHYHKTFAGHAIEGKYREQGSSAGLVNWLCSKLLIDGLVDSIIHVKEDKESTTTMYSYQESTNIESLQAGAKSKYYPIELSHVIRMLQAVPEKRVAIVGLPCFIKALRALENQHPELKRQVKFHIGIVCGHLKSKNYAEFLAWQAGIAPDDLKLLDFRTKLSDRPASKYGFTAIPKVGDEDAWIIKAMSEVVGGNWGHGVFKLTACEYCDDVMAETADIVFGDAWLPEYVQDSKGTNIVNSRSSFLTKLLEDEAKKGNLNLIELPPKRIVDSQRSGLRHRREGLSYRSSSDIDMGRPFPKKRTAAGSYELSLERKQTYQYREMIRINSHKSFLLAKEYKDLTIALNTLEPIIESYSKINRAKLSRRIIKKVKSTLRRYIDLVLR